MKRIFIFVLTLLALSPAAFSYNSNGSDSYCANLTNAWLFSNTPYGGAGNATLSVIQNGATITGEITNLWCAIDGAYETFDIGSGTQAKGNGQWNIVARSDGGNGNGGGNCQYVQTITIPVGAAGCGTAGDSAGRAYLANECFVPGPTPLITGGENPSSTAFIAWTEPGVAEFATSLNPASIGSWYNDFSGRASLPTVGTGTSTCNPPTVALINNGIALPDASVGTFYPGQYDIDLLGYTSTAVINNIRANSPSLPCVISYSESVSMDCQGPRGISWVNFQTNVPIKYTIGGTPATLTLQRNSAAQTTIYGSTKANMAIEDLIIDITVMSWR